jgi:hypothetical protein
MMTTSKNIELAKRCNQSNYNLLITKEVFKIERGIFTPDKVPVDPLLIVRKQEIVPIEPPKKQFEL